MLLGNFAHEGGRVATHGRGEFYIVGDCALALEPWMKRSACYKGV